MVAISIVIPVYNVEKYLKECLDSIIRQTFNDFEVICVNDGSSDNSLNILKEYAPKDLRFKIISQEKRGAGDARNNGLKYAQGEFVIFLDSDDYFEPTMLEDLYNKAKEFDADLVVCSCKKVNELGEVIENSNPQWPIKLDITPMNKVFCWKDYPDDILNMFCVIPWNKLCKREMLVKNDIDFQNLSSSNDVTFGHKVKICAKKIVVFDRQLVNYRYNHVESISKTRAEHTINIIHSAKEVKDFLIKKGLYENLEKSFIEAYKNHIRAEISSCSEEQYEIFKNEFKTLYPDFYNVLNSALKCDFLTLEYLNNYIKESTVYLWGASNFLKKLLEKEERPNPNILGIIDKNEALYGKYFGNYKIYSPDILKTKPANILVTIYNNHEKAYSAIKKEVEEKYPKVSFLNNIFLNTFNLQDILSKDCEIKSCTELYNEIKRFDIKEKHIQLVKNLDSRSKDCVTTILERIKKIATSKEYSNLFSNEENRQINMLMEDFYKNCYCINEGCYAYKNYLLPIKHFEPSVLYYKHNIDNLKTLNKIKNKAIIDVGAFIGDSAIVLQNYTNNNVYSFEPTNKNFSLLLKTIELNHSKRIIPQKYALGSKNEEIEIYLQGSASSINRKLVENPEIEKIKVITLDNFVRDNNIEVGLIKVDIEGFEQEFLKGALDTIKSQKPILLISIYHNASDFFEIKPYIETLNLGYSFKIIKPIDGTIRGEILLLAELE